MARISQTEFGRIYGEVNSAEDIRRINRIIRKEMDAVTTREEPTELKKRNSTTYTLPERWVERTKVVELPRSAKGVRLTDRAPEGPLQAVA